MADLGSNILQENLLTLLAFDDKYSKVIRGSVELHTFGGLYNEIAVRIYSYIDKHKEPPKKHLPDILDDKLNSKNKKESKLYKDIVLSIYETYEDINSEYVMSQLETHVKRQNFSIIAVDLIKALQQDTEESLEKAEQLINKAQTSTLKVFDPGIQLSDKDKALGFLDLSNNSFPLGIPELDKRGFGPTLKELLLYIADTKAGKSWFLTHVAKVALMHRLRVSHITLEMSQDRVAQRYMQTFFSMAKRKEKTKVIKFKRDKLGRIKGYKEKIIKPKLSLDDPKIGRKLGALHKKWSTRAFKNIIIKEFPTGALTIPQLRSYLDTLEITKRFTPHILLVDYPDLMKMDKSQLRHEIDQIYKDLRGIAGERNLAVIVVSQSHRSASKAKLVGSENVAEAYSKVQHADCIITYSQTIEENKLGLARLFVSGGRNDQDKLTIVISQNYGIGQYVLDSNLMVGNYWNLIENEESE